VDVGRLVIPDHLCGILDGFSHDVEVLELILSQPTPLSLASRCGGVMMVLDSCESVSYSTRGEGVLRGSLEPMANLQVVIPATKMV
jgi:hypothetical protein